MTNIKVGQVWCWNKDLAYPDTTEWKVISISSAGTCVLEKIKVDINGKDSEHPVGTQAPWGLNMENATLLRDSCELEISDVIFKLDDKRYFAVEWRSGRHTIGYVAIYKRHGWKAYIGVATGGFNEFVDANEIIDFGTSLSEEEARFIFRHNNKIKDMEYVM